MIGHVIVNGPWLKGSSGTNLPYINTMPSNPMQGVIRINSYGQLELNSGGYWQGFSQNASTIDTTMSTNAILAWAERKMMDEERYTNLARQSTAVADAVAALHTAEEQLRVVVSLTQENK